MPATRLATRRIEKIWGRHQLGFGFPDAPGNGKPIGEIWFETPGGTRPELLVKYLFTSAKLSVQVHPDDAQARAHGHQCGKEECWLILDTEPEAKIGLGLVDRMDEEVLRAAALDGSIEQMLDWKNVSPGDVYYLPAGTVHAIGAGVTLLEVQQNIDLTYRLYDYGRPRELHLDDAVAVATRNPWVESHAQGNIGPGRTVLAGGRKFALEKWTGKRNGLPIRMEGTPLWLIPIDGSGSVEGETLEPGTVWIAEGETDFRYSGTILAAYPGAEIAATA